MRSSLATFDIIETWQRLTGEVPRRVSAHEYAVTCPVHDDETPSCHLNPQKNVALCRSCGWKGNAISLTVALGIARDNREAFDVLRRLKVPAR